MTPSSDRTWEYNPTSIIQTSIIRTLDYPNSIDEENCEVKVQQGPRGRVRTRAYAYVRVL